MFTPRCAIAVAFLLCCEACLIPTPCCDASFIKGGEPPGWTLVAPAGQRSVAGVSDQGAHRGHYSAVVATWDTTAIGAGLVQEVRADRYRGRRVRVSAWLRETASTNRDNALWARVVSPNDGAAWASSPLAASMPQRANAFGLSRWQRSEIVIDVPDDATTISFGVLLVGTAFERKQGPGPHQMLVDDVSLEIVDRLTALAGKRSAVIDDFLSRMPRIEPLAAPMNLDFEMR